MSVASWMEDSLAPLYRIWSCLFGNSDSIDPRLLALVLNHAAAEFGIVPRVEVDDCGTITMVGSPGERTCASNLRRNFKQLCSAPVRPYRPTLRKGGDQRWRGEERRPPLEEDPFWWKTEMISLCFELPMTPVADIVGSTPNPTQWWDVVKLTESDNFIAVSKPAGMFVLTDDGGLWHQSPTNFIHVANKRFEMPCSTEPRQRGICHRLDCNTSGVQIFAKEWDGFEHFRVHNSAHRMHKEYICLVDGRLGSPDKPNVGIIDAPLKKWQDFSRREHGSIVCTEEGQPAVSKYRVLRQWRVPAKDDTKFWGRDRWFSLVQMRILTGRTHQIRVHMALIGHPLIGDEKYNPSSYEHDFAITPRIFLHCLRMEFEDMDTSLFKATSELAPDLQVALHRIHQLSDSVSSDVENPVAAITPSSGFGFPGLAWLLEHTQQAAPEELLNGTTCQVRTVSHFNLNCRQMEVMRCEMAHRDDTTALVWTLRLEQTNGDDYQMPITNDKEATWGPAVLWVPTELQKLAEIEAKDVEGLHEAAPEELGEHWGKYGSRWTWAHNGSRQNGWFSLHSGGILDSKWGAGTWQLLNVPTPPLLLVTFHSVEHALRLTGAGTVAVGFNMVSRRRLAFEPSLAKDASNGNGMEGALHPDAPICGPTRGWPDLGPVPASGGA